MSKIADIYLINADDMVRRRKIMENEFDVIALGELLIDFTMNGKSEQGKDFAEECVLLQYG